MGAFVRRVRVPDARAASTRARGGHAHWIWLAAFFLLFTVGELFILPIGLGLFARLAPAGHAATTIAAWYFASFGGNLLAGALGTLWSAMGHAAFFVVMAGVAALAGVLLRLLDPAVVRVGSREWSQPPTSGPESVLALIDSFPIRMLTSWKDSADMHNHLAHAEPPGRWQSTHHITLRHGDAPSVR